MTCRRTEAFGKPLSMLHEHKRNEVAMPKYVKLEDIQSFPIRLDHCDREHGNIHFILGIESVMEYIDYLPQYECQDTEPIVRPDYEYPEPRIISLEEARSLCSKNSCDKIVWVDYRPADWKNNPENKIPMFIDFLEGIEKRETTIWEMPVEVFVFPLNVEKVSEYGKLFVFWTDRPTEEQRWNVRWNHSENSI